MSALTVKTIEEFNEITQNNQNVIVDFYAEWCGPCKTQGPIFETFAINQEKEIKGVKVDIEKLPKLAQQFGVRSIPTLVSIQNGEVVKSHTGVKTENQLEEWVAPLIGLAN